MKNLSLLFLLLFTAAAAYAQPEKGQVMLNLAGNGYFGDRGNPAYRYHRFGTQLSGAYFLTHRLAAGLQTELKLSSDRGFLGPTYTSANRFQNQTLRVGPMARYYLPVGKKTAFFVQATAGWEQRSIRSQHTNSASGGTEKFRYNFPSAAYAHITPGFAYNPTRRLALEVTAFEIGYLYRPYYFRGQHRWGVNALNAKIGATFFIGKGKEKPAVPTP